MKYALIFFLCNILLACKNSSKKLTVTDFDCRGRIRKIVCLVDPYSDDYVLGKTPLRPCLKGSDRYVEPFERIYDTFPGPMQKMFCALDFIYIEKDFFGTGYGGGATDENGKKYVAIGIKQRALDEKLTLSQWLSWKEQLSFGNEKKDYGLTAGLPKVVAKTSKKINDFLFFFLSHEFAHLLEEPNKINETHNCKKKKKEKFPVCEPQYSTWGYFSWQTQRKARSSSEFENRDKLCFYRCNKNYLSKKEVNTLYSSIQNSPFLTAYGSVQMRDDFADAFAMFLWDKYAQGSYVVESGQGLRFDIVEKMKTKKFQTKYDYIQSLLNRRNLRYPVPSTIK